MTPDPIVAADLRINPRWIIPVQPAGAVLEDHAVLIQGDRIAAVVSNQEADERYRAKETINLPDHVVLPGLINMHGHAAMSLFRGMADDLPLMTWLNDHIWPAEGQFVDAAFIATGTQLAMAEMLRTGTTTFSDMYFFPEIAAQVAHDAGMRAQICFPLLDFPTIWGSGPDEYFDKGRAIIEQWRDDSRIMPAIGPHAPYTVSNGPLDDSDIRALTSSGAHIVHCPESNLKLASGLCPVQQLTDAGINVTLGTDGAASNNDHDMFGEMNTAAMIGKVVADDAAAVSAHQTIAMATLNGARALGREDELGSLEAGKLADLIAVDLGDPFLQPVYDPASHLVYSNHGRQVTHSWIGGIPQVQNGQLTRIDVPDLMLRVREWSAKISRR
jgi:5-methylthioadenosine/S-adenosylhomocysteine deaminase